MASYDNSTNNEKADETTAPTVDNNRLQQQNDDDSDETEEEVEEEITEYYTVQMNLASDGSVLATTYISCDKRNDVQQNRGLNNLSASTNHGLLSENARSSFLGNGQFNSLGTPSVAYRSGNINLNYSPRNNRNWEINPSSASASVPLSNISTSLRYGVPRTYQDRNYYGPDDLDSESNTRIEQPCNRTENQRNEKSHEANAEPKREKFQIPQKTDVFIKHSPASGGSDIQTITRTDSKTDNVVVLIRPRAPTPQEFEDDKPHSFDKLSENGLKNQQLNSERGLSKDNSVNTLENSISNDNEKVSPERDFNEICRPKSRCNYDGFLSPTTSPVTENGHVNVFDTHTRTNESMEQSGAKPKFISRERAKSFPETGDSVNKQNRGVRYDSDPPRTNDDEEKVYHELLQSMKSVTSGTKVKAKPESQRTGVDDVPDSPIKDINSENTPSEDSACNLSDQSLSERLQKKQAGGVTVITFLSPRYDKTSAINFTPLKCSKTKTIPVKAREVFRQHANDVKKSLPYEQSVPVRDKTNRKSPIHTSPKLLSPSLHLDKLLGDGCQGDSVVDESKVK